MQPVSVKVSAANSTFYMLRLWSRTNQPLAELTLPQLWLAPPAASTPATGVPQHEAASATASSLVSGTTHSLQASHYDMHCTWFQGSFCCVQVPSAVIQSPPTSSIAAVHLTSSRHIATSSHADPVQLVKAATTLQVRACTRLRCACVADTAGYCSLVQKGIS